MNRVKAYIDENFSSFLYFYSYLKHRIFIAMLLSIGVGMMDGFGLAMFMPLLQMVGEDGALEVEGLGKLSFIVEALEGMGVSLTLFSVLTVMTIFFFLKGFALFGSKAYRVLLQQRFVRNMRLRMVNALNKIGFKDFVTSDVGRIQNTMTGEVERVSQAYAFYFLTVEQSVLVLVYMAFAFFVDFQFALLVTVGGGLTNFLYKNIYKKTKGASRTLTKDSNTYQGQVIQYVTNYKYLRATGLTSTFTQKLKETVNSIERNRKKIGIYGSLLIGSREPLLIVVVSIVILVETLILGGNLGGVLVSLLFFYRALNALVMMQNSWNRFLEQSGSLENVVNFQKELEEQVLSDGEKSLGGFKEKITIEDLEFGFENTKIIRAVNLEIRKNESVAFVGESGSGKTTLVNIIAGLLPPDEGHISIDGIPYSQLKMASFQKRIGYITQEPVIFNDSIYNNITFWEEKTPENITRFNTALHQASLGKFIQGLEQKEETQLGNNGINLSGGQKQRISIARELYKDVDILIMDEATSALDSKTEKRVQANIESLRGQYTLLIVAHRLSTIKSVDRIVMMNRGKIQDEGKFEELIERLPRFRKMVELQEV